VNREIKFRGISVQSGKWVYGHLAYIDNTGAVIATKAGGVPVLVGTVGQFTGLLDIVGKEIYEGDIVKNPHWSSGHKCKKCGFQEEQAGIFQILWENLSVGERRNTTVARFVQKEAGGWTTYEFDESEDYEVIGTTYENKDLLK
jgi:hypothetical protein